MTPFAKTLLLSLVGIGGVLAAQYAHAEEQQQPSLSVNDGAALYATHCSTCHGGDRFGGIGPALLPESIAKLRGSKLTTVITQGRAASQMPAFGEELSAPEIEAVARYLRTPPVETPVWALEQMQASHSLLVDPQSLPAKPVHSADPLNLFTVVEAGDHHVTILDGDKLEPLARFQSRFALHGGAKYSPDGRFVYLASRDGWVTLYDLYSLQTVAEIRVGLNTRNAAVSADGRFVMIGNMLPHSLVVLDARDLSPLRVIPVEGDKGETSRVSAVYTAPPRGSFIVALKDMPEVWEIPYVKPKKPIYPGFVHNYQPGMVEALGVQDQAFALRRIKLEDHLDDFFFDQDYRNLIGAARDGVTGQVVNLTVGRKIADIALDGMPHLGSGITFPWQGKSVLATPHLKDGKISVIDMESWQTVKTIKTKGPGFFMRSHENSPYAWVDVFFGPDKDAVHVIDKQSLEIVKTLRPAPGKVAAHVEFDRYGRYVLLSIWDQQGALVVYDAQTLEEIKRIPMVKPVGKYNVYNKITYSAGTSH